MKVLKDEVNEFIKFDAMSSAIVFFISFDDTRVNSLQFDMQGDIL